MISTASTAPRAAFRIASKRVAISQQRRYAARRPTYEPPTEIRLGPTHSLRYQEHYHNTLAEDLMYMQYNYLPAGYTPPKPPRLPQHDPSDPYAVNRPTPRLRGNKRLTPLAKPTNDQNVIKLSAIHLQMTSKAALSSRINLLNAIAQLRAISAQTKGGGGYEAAKGVEVIRARSNVPTWHIRRGMAMGAKVTLKGQQMYDFLNTFVEFVLPRVREFPGLVMPTPSASEKSTSMTSGVVSCGFGPDVLELFPQIEVNQDLYAKMHGLYVHFVTTARGKGAQHRARALMSGFQIPFIRK
jgi:large subunit ribosomal protein L5